MRSVLLLSVGLGSLMFVGVPGAPRPLAAEAARSDRVAELEPLTEELSRAEIQEPVAASIPAGDSEGPPPVSHRGWNGRWSQALRIQCFGFETEAGLRLDPPYELWLGHRLARFTSEHRAACELILSEYAEDLEAHWVKVEEAARGAWEQHQEFVRYPAGSEAPLPREEVGSAFHFDDLVYWDGFLYRFEFRSEDHPDLKLHLDAMSLLRDARDMELRARLLEVR